MRYISKNVLDCWRFKLFCSFFTLNTSTRFRLLEVFSVKKDLDLMHINFNESHYSKSEHKCHHKAKELVKWKWKILFFHPPPPFSFLNARRFFFNCRRYDERKNDEQSANKNYDYHYNIFITGGVASQHEEVSEGKSKNYSTLLFMHTRKNRKKIFLLFPRKYDKHKNVNTK